MDTQSAPTVSHGRVLAFRIVAGVFGALTLLLTIGGALRVVGCGTTIRRSDRPGPFGPFETSSKSTNFRANYQQIQC